VGAVTSAGDIAAASRSERTPHLTSFETAFGLNRLDRRAAVPTVLTFFQGDSIGLPLGVSNEISVILPCLLVSLCMDRHPC